MLPSMLFSSKPNSYSVVLVIFPRESAIVPVRLLSPRIST
uniref:Uncharacterized protein n=1 Tax=Arundo donax TaxID=35708 RepID=A0A0A8Z727_ARUDO